MSDTVLQVARDQLGRMRGMTALYHRRFFADVWLTATVYLAVLSVGYLGAAPVFATLAFVALLGSVLTAFDASYLMFARHYAADLEAFVNGRLGADVLVGARLEEAYLFPLRGTKIVTIRLGRGFTWFGFVTVFLTLLGVAGYGLGVALALPTFETGAAVFAYVTILGALTVGALVAGTWWFVAGTGEARLDSVLAGPFAASRAAAASSS